MEIDRAFDRMEDVRKLPRFRQTQKPLLDQLTDLMDVANQLGLYDAADFVKYRLDDGK